MNLKVSSKALDPAELGITELADLLGSASTSFIKENEGLIGWGEATRLTSEGKDRISQLDTAWKELVAQAEIEDEVKVSGSGLVAFGSITFSSESTETSVLVIPQLIIGKTDNNYFITTINITLDEAKALIQEQPEANHLEFHSGKVSPELFEENVIQAKALIAEGKLSKVVLARDLVATATNFNPNPGLLKLTKRYPTCYTYLVDGMFGASPELLVSVENKSVSARVLAGTAGRGTDVEVDKAIGEALANSHKNLDEHKYAIDSLTAAMSELCIEIEASSEPFSLALHNLWHLASDVSAKLKADSTSLQLLEALHPSAAVAGTPRDKALEVISELEAIDRGGYAGPVGWVSANGDGVWAIALRGAQQTDNTIRAFAGCGIVAESDPASELAETNLKFKAVLENL
jgi:menaquinone-specific isochorismate synthase